MAAHQTNPVPIWLDCDTGHDDAFAVLLAAHHPSAKLLGISTVHGNAEVEKTAYNTRAVLQAIGVSEINVVAGAPRPLCRDPLYAPSIHGESGLGGVTLLPEPSIKSSTPSIEAAADAASKAILSQPPSTVALVATGPLSNVARLFEKYPQVARHISALSIMGGAAGGDFAPGVPMGFVEGEGERFGNYSPWAEFNILADPEAARAVLTNKDVVSKTTLIPLDLTHQVLGTEEVQRRLFGGQHAAAGGGNVSRVRMMFKETMTFFAETYRTHFGISRGPPLHDPLAVSAVLPGNQSLFDDRNGERWRLDVVIERSGYDKERDPQNHTGQTVLSKVEDSGVRIPRTVDLQPFWNSIDEALTKAEEIVLR